MANSLSKIRLGHPLRPYYYGQRKWENYLVDIQEAVIEENTSNRAVIREGFATAETSIALLSDLQAGIEDLAEKFEWGLALLIDGQERQIERLNKIVDQLEAVRKAVQSPLLTKAKELFTLGQEHLRDGFLGEALEKFLAAENINKVNFPLQLQLGKLYLYGKNKTDEVINLEKSEEHLLLAARYAGVDKQWQRYRGEAFFHAAVANYVASGQIKDDGRPTVATLCLERALIHLQSSLEAWPEFDETHYLEAKCYALLEKKQEALEQLKILAKKNPFGYFEKADQDGDFNAIRGDVTALFNSEIGPINQMIERGRNAQSRAREIMGKNFLGTEEVATFFGVTYHYQQLQHLSVIPFSEEFLWQHRNTHVLVAGFPITRLEIIEAAGKRMKIAFDDNVEHISSRVSCEWYLFCKTPIGWEPEPLKMSFENQKKLLKADELIPNNDELTYVVILYFMATSEKLFEGGAVRSCDVSHPCYIYDDGTDTGSHFGLLWWREAGGPKLYLDQKIYDRHRSILHSTTGLISMQKGNLSSEKSLAGEKNVASRTSRFPSATPNPFSECRCSFCGRFSELEKCAICGKFFCKSHGEHLDLWYERGRVHWIRCREHPRKRKGIASLMMYRSSYWEYWEVPDLYEIYD